MKSIIAVLLLGLFVVALGGCARSAEELALEQRANRAETEVARRDAIAELNSAKRNAVVAGARFAADGALTRRDQCNSRLAGEAMKKSPELRLHPDEIRQPFIDGCLREANANVRNQRLAALEAKRVAKAQQMRLATAKKSAAQKR